PKGETQHGVRYASVSSYWINREDIRFDATAYAQDAFAALQRIESCGYAVEPLGKLVGRIYHPTENQPRSNFKRIWVGREHGRPFLSTRQLFFFRPDPDRYVSSSMPKLPELLPVSGSLLLSRSGTLGYPVLVGSWLSKFVI